MELTASPQGQLPTQQSGGGFILPPTFRQKVWGVATSFGEFGSERAGISA